MNSQFLIYNASAGSGKTYVIAKEFLSLSLKYPNSFSRILALTFTNKAAGEMKHRIIEVLREAYMNDYKQGKYLKGMMADFVATTGLSEADVLSACRKLLGQILHNYSRFSVSTIDSFVQNIIRTFANDLRIAPDYEVEMDSESVLSQIIDALIAKCGNQNPEITKVLTEFILSQLTDEKNFVLEDEIMNIAKMIFNEESYGFIDNVVKENDNNIITTKDYLEVRKRVAEIIRKIEDELTAIAQKADDLIKSTGLDGNCFSHRNHGGIYDYFRKIAEKNYDSFYNSNVKYAIDTKDLSSKGAKQDEKNKIQAITDEVIVLYNKLKEKYEANHDKYYLFKNLLPQIYTMALFSEILRLLESYKDENKVMLISEANRIIADIVRQTDTPFIYERLGNRYRHFLLDEFQDTSRLQWSNLLPLISESFSFAGNKTLIVGDGKQSIYRFRNSDVSQFVRLSELKNISSSELITAERQLKNFHYDYCELHKKEPFNFRSGSNIIAFNNAFFAFQLDKMPENLKPIYKSYEQKPTKDKQNIGYVQISFIKNEKKEIENEVENENESGYEDSYCIEVKKIIDDLIGKKGYQYKDIAILCRHKKNAGKLARYLMRNEINVVSSESLELRYSREVQFIVSVLRHQHYKLQQDGVNLFSYLYQKNTNLTNFSEAIIQFLQNTKNTNTKNFFYQYDEVPDFTDLPVYEACIEIIRFFNLYDTAKGIDIYLNFFLESVYEFTKTNGNDWSYFFKWWDTDGGKRSVIIPETIDAVRIMTIHKSKGLQFPVVIHPYANNYVYKEWKKYIWTELKNLEEFAPLSSMMLKVNKKIKDVVINGENLFSAEDEKAYLDLLNLLYVAHTRPEERLYILTNQSKKASDEDKSKKKDNNQSEGMNKWLTDFIENDQNSPNPMFKKISENKYFFGNDEKRMSDEPKKKEDEKTLVLNYFQEKHSFPQLRVKSNYYNIAEAEEASVYGNLIHNLLAQIKYQTELDSTLERAKIEGYLLESQEENVRKTLMNVLTHEKLVPFFSSAYKIVSEKEVISPRHTKQYTYRPDRIAFQENEAYICDFKTGIRKKEHNAQLAEYVELIKEMGYKVASAYLVYISQDSTEVAEIEC